MVAWGQLRGCVVVLARLEPLYSLSEFSHFLARPTAWVGGFDLPFGLPRELVQTLGVAAIVAGVHAPLCQPEP